MPEKVTIYHKEHGFAEMWAASADEAVRDHPNEWSRKAWPGQKPNPRAPVSSGAWTSSDPADNRPPTGTPQRHDRDSPAFDPRYPPEMITQGAQNPDRDVAPGPPGPKSLAEENRSRVADAAAAAAAATKVKVVADEKPSHRR